MGVRFVTFIIFHGRPWVDRHIVEGAAMRIGIDVCSTHTDTATRSVWTWTPIVLMAGVVIVLAAVLSPPETRARAEQIKAEQIDQENRALCGMLGMPVGSDGYAACAGVLLEVRTRQAKRFAAEMADF